MNRKTLLWSAFALILVAFGCLQFIPTELGSVTAIKPGPTQGHEVPE